MKPGTKYGRIRSMNTLTFQTEYIAARKSWLEKQFSFLNPMQRLAVMATEGPVLILAGAGSGKTTVLIHRIANLLRYGSASDSDTVPDTASEAGLSALHSLSEDAETYARLYPVPAWKILAITFTNKAADELKSRLDAIIGPSSRDIWACTFHSACVRILRRDAERLGYTNSFVIYDSADSLSLIKRILKDLNLDDKLYPPKQLLSEISRAKDSMVLPEDYLGSAQHNNDVRKRKLAEIYKEYNRRLFVSNAMDFDDLIMNTVLLLQGFDDLRDYWQNRFSYIMVDEYQDTNHSQYLLISLLSSKHRNLCVVGDDDQSIYRFRGASIENILSFEKQYPDCRTVRLEQNYRSTEQILEAANRVISHNIGRKGKKLWTDLGRGNPVHIHEAHNEAEEAYAISSSILANYAKGMQWRDHAVLYRINALSSQLEFAMKRAGIPYQVIGGARFFDRAEIKDILSYLSVIADPRDDLRLSRIINVPPRGIGDRSVAAAQSIAFESGLSLFDVFEQADKYPELSRPAIKMRQFASMIRELQDYSSDTADLYDRLLDQTGYLEALKNSKDEKDQSRIENVQELKSSIISYQNETGDSTLGGYLASIALYTDLDSMERDTDCVVLMTIHSAKGLEFPYVYIAGMEEGIFPGLRSIGDQPEMEEERRLCYVAFTRAKEQLTVSYAKQRMLFGKTTSNRRSRFLEEADLISDDHGTSPSYYERKQNASTLFSVESRKPKTESKKPVLSKKEPPSLPKLEIGMRVKHTAFGIGSICKMTPMGGDYLLEIQFEQIGTKKLMLRAAAKFIQML